MSNVLLSTLQATTTHARALLDAAKILNSSGHANFSYHLCVLALEEIGRCELLQMQEMSDAKHLDKDWLVEHEKSHTKKLFWCFFPLELFSERVNPQRFQELQVFAKEIHEKRLASLYMDRVDNSLSLPSNKISNSDANTIIKVTSDRIDSLSVLKERVPTEKEINDQAWFLKAVENPQYEKIIFSKESLAQLRGLANANKWVDWIKEKIKTDALDSYRAIQSEVQRSKQGHSEGKPKWKVQVKLFTLTHSVRPKVLSEWNAINSKFKFVFLQKKDQVLVELNLDDDVMIDGLYVESHHLFCRFLLALNISTMGFWFSEISPHQEHFYDAIYDLDRPKTKLVMQIYQGASIIKEKSRVFDIKSAALLSSTFLALPEHINEYPPFEQYLNGLTLLAKNNVFFRSEGAIFNYFLDCIFGLMTLDQTINAKDQFITHFQKFYRDIFTDKDEEERFIQIISSLKAGTPLAKEITLEEAFHMKLYCDAYFLNRFQPRIVELATQKARA